MNNNNTIVSKNFTRQPYKGQGIYKTSGGISPSAVGNVQETYPYNPFADTITVSGTRLTSFLSSFTGKISKIYIINRNAAGTHFPVQISVYQNPTPEANASTWTKLAQTGDIAMTTDGLKVASGLSISIVQGYQYYIGISRNGAGGGTTSPTLHGRNGGYNNVFSSIDSSDLSAATPATFTTNITANTVAGWTAGTATSASCYVRLIFA